MREHSNPVRSWVGYCIGIMVETGYVAVMIAAAALVAWAVMLR